MMWTFETKMYALGAITRCLFTRDGNFLQFNPFPCMYAFHTFSTIEKNCKKLEVEFLSTLFWLFSCERWIERERERDVSTMAKKIQTEQYGRNKHPE